MAAELAGIEDRTGSIQQGLEADLIVVDQNPLDNILSLQDVLMVVNNGKVVHDPLELRSRINMRGKSRIEKNYEPTETDWTKFKKMFPKTSR